MMKETRWLFLPLLPALEANTVWASVLDAHPVAPLGVFQLRSPLALPSPSLCLACPSWNMHLLWIISMTLRSPPWRTGWGWPQSPSMVYSAQLEVCSPWHTCSASCFLLLFSSSCSAVLLDSGARYESPYPSGITHFLEKLAFQVSHSPPLLSMPLPASHVLSFIHLIKCSILAHSPPPNTWAEMTSYRG